MRSSSSLSRPLKVAWPLGQISGPSGWKTQSPPKPPPPAKSSAPSRCDISPPRNEQLLLILQITHLKGNCILCSASSPRRKACGRLRETSDRVRLECAVCSEQTARNSKKEELEVAGLPLASTQRVFYATRIVHARSGTLMSSITVRGDRRKRSREIRRSL